jgi:SAM-dependent methyltransferase
MPDLQLPPRGTLTPIGASDPLLFYYKPLIGQIFRARINLGLRLLEGRFKRVLEIGYGSGLLIPTLSTIADEVYGVDIEPEPPALRATLSGLGASVRDLKQSDVRQLPFPDGQFDGAVAFSIFEHLKHDQLGPAMREVARVLQPGARFLIGCPAVHRAMNAAFAAIGFSGIEHHHFSSISGVLDAAKERFSIEKRATLPKVLDRMLPLGWAPYTTVLLRKR